MTTEQELSTLRAELEKVTKERDEAQRRFKLYAGMFTRIKDQIIAGYGPEEFFRWQEALKENDKGDGKIDAVSALISYFYKLCRAKSEVAAERDAALAQLAAARADTERLNWLEKAATEDHPSFPMLDNGEWCYPLIVGQGTVHAGVGTCVFKTIRAAIDSAKEGEVSKAQA